MRPTRAQALALQGPVIVAMLVFVGAPTAFLIVTAFAPGGMFQLQYGDWSTSAFSLVWTDTFRIQLTRSVGIGLASTAVSIIAGFTLANWVMFHARRTNIWLSLIVVALIASFIARIYAWRTVLGSEGPVSRAFQVLGLIDEPQTILLFTRPAVIIAQVSVLIPLCALILASAFSRIDHQLLEAARTQGYGSLRILTTVTLPLSGPAVLTATSFSFFLSTGDYLTPSLLGGANSTTLGSVIAGQYQITGNYAAGAVVSLVMLVVFGAFFVLARLALRVLGMLPDWQ